MGAVSKEGDGVGIRINPPKNIDVKSLYSFKLYFECTNNVAEYEALILGLNVLKDLRAKRIFFCGDSNLSINQVKGVFQTKHPRMRSYRNLVLELFENFSEFTIFVIPREHDGIANALATSASVFKIIIYPNRRHEIKVKYRPAIPDNVKYWQVFEDNQQIKRFLESDEEFVNTQIDEENMLDK
jgi:ribonuclease HI